MAVGLFFVCGYACNVSVLSVKTDLMDWCPQLSLIRLQQVSPPPPPWLTAHRSCAHLSLLEGGRQRDLECLGPWLLYCSPVRTIVQRCIIRAHHLSPSGRCRVSALHKESPLHSKSFFFLAERKKAQIFLFFFTESPVLVCQIMQHKCLQGMFWMVLLCTEKWKICVSIWQQFTPAMPTVYNAKSKNDSDVADWASYQKTPLFCIFTFLNTYTG